MGDAWHACHSLDDSWPCVDPEEVSLEEIYIKFISTVHMYPQWHLNNHFSCLGIHWHAASLPEE